MEENKSKNYIDVWANMRTTLRKYGPIETFILLATRGYGHSIRQISKILELSPIEVKKIIRKLERAIRKDLKKNGANLDRITHLSDGDFIVEVNDSEEDNN